MKEPHVPTSHTETDARGKRGKAGVYDTDDAPIRTRLGRIGIFNRPDHAPTTGSVWIIIIALLAVFLAVYFLFLS